MALSRAAYGFTFLLFRCFSFRKVEESEIEEGNLFRGEMRRWKEAYWGPSAPSFPKNKARIVWLETAGFLLFLLEVYANYDVKIGRARSFLFHLV